MPKIQVYIDQVSGELQIMTDGIDGDLSFGEGVTLTDVIRGGIDAATGGGLVLKSDVEQHKPGGVRHAHIHSPMRQGTGG